MAFGYRIFRLVVTPYRKVTPEYQFDDPVFGAPGALGVLSEVAAALVAKTGDADPKKSHYFRCDEALQDGWVITFETSGGEFGVEREVVDSATHQAKPGIGKTDVVMAQTRFILAVPPNGDSAVLVSLVEGRSHGTPGLISALNKELRPRGFTVRLEWNVTDAVAWNQYLDRSDIDVTGVELIEHKSPGSDHTNFAGPGVVKATLGLQLANAGSLKDKLLAQLSKSRRENSKPNLAGVVGISAPAEDFDEERVVYVADGRKRRLTVSQDYPVFIYSFGEYDALPPLSDFLNTAHDDVAHIFKELKVDRPQDWWMAVPDAVLL